MRRCGCYGKLHPVANLAVVAQRTRAPKCGDHIRVRRFLSLYWHHGIYVSDDRVIQFGSGINGKRHATVEATTLAGFAGRGRVEVVLHGDHTGPFGPVGPPDYRANVVHRAEWLLDNHPIGRYHLVGWNCEHVATFCVNGQMESPQVRRVSVSIGFSIFALMMVFLPIKRPSKWLYFVGWPLGAAGLYLVFVYNHVTPRVWRELEENWKQDHPPRDAA
jgi:hypothetical protein